MTDEKPQEPQKPQRPQIPPRRPTAERFWLTPYKTPHSNALLKGTTENVGDLELELCVSEDNTLCSDSAWALSDDQRKLIAAGANIRLGVWQHPIPPLSVEIEAPFCGSCGSSKVYVGAESAFFCAGACPERDPRFGPAPVVPANDSPAASPLEEAHADFRPVADDDDVPPAA